MAIIGKDYYALLERTVGPDPATGYTTLKEFTTLYYHHSRTSPEAVFEQYGITADTEAAVTGSTLATFLIGGSPGDDPEDRMLDTAPYQAIEGSAGTGGFANFFAFAYDSSRGGWRGPNDPFDIGALGVPSTVWAFFPDNPLWADTTPTPFGSYGNGLIHYQFITRWPHDPELDSTERHEPFDTPPTDYMGQDAGGGPGTYTGVMYVGAIDYTYIFMPVEGEEGATPPPPVTGVDDEEILLRVWGYTLDGHDFYVLRIGANETLVYDLTTDQWASWRSLDRDNWRPHVGMNWVGLASTTTARGFGTNVVCGDDESGTLFILDPDYGKDDKPDGSTIELFERTVTGGLSLNGREVAPCNALTLDLSHGAPSVGTTASVTLRTSDDFGHTWVDHGTSAVSLADFSTVVEWRSLGLMRAPGRVFEITDSGATVRLGRADLR